MNAPPRFGRTSGPRPALAILLVLLTLSCASPGQGRADLRVLSAIGMKQVMLELAPRFEQSTGVRLVTTFDSGGVIRERLAAGHEADVILVPRSVAATLAQEHRSKSVAVDIAESEVAVAVRRGARKPDITSVGSFRDAMLAATSIACPDPALAGSSGVHIARVFEQLGIADQVRPKLVLASTPSQPGTLPGDLLAAGKAEIALHQMQELLAVDGIEVVGALPPEIQGHFVFSAMIPRGSRDPAAAERLIAFLTSAEARKAIEAIGMKPVPAHDERR